MMLRGCCGLGRLRLGPHLVETFKFSRDPHLEDKVTDVVGLYLNPPDNLGARFHAPEGRRGDGRLVVAP